MNQANVHSSLSQSIRFSIVYVLHKKSTDTGASTNSYFHCPLIDLLFVCLPKVTLSNCLLWLTDSKKTNKDNLIKN